MTTKTKHIFIGGSGRSGTTLLGNLFRAHPDVIYFGEPGFLIEEHGANDYINGSTTRDEFKHAAVTRVHDRLQKKLSAYGYQNASLAYSAQRISDVVENHLLGQGSSLDEMSYLIEDLLGIGRLAEGKRHWVEKTPRSIIMADTLFAMFPDMRYFHMIREPKSVCASFLQQTWGVDSVEDSVANYCEMMQRGFQSQARVSCDQYFVISLETLARQVDAILPPIFESCGIRFDSDIIQGCASLVSRDRVNTLRWPDIIDSRDAKLIDKRCGPIYRKWLTLERKTLGRLHV